MHKPIMDSIPVHDIVIDTATGKARYYEPDEALQATDLKLRTNLTPHDINRRNPPFPERPPKGEKPVLFRDDAHVISWAYRVFHSPPASIPASL